MAGALAIRVSWSINIWEMFDSGGVNGGPGRDRTDDLFHAMEARSQLRHRPTALLPSILADRDAFVKRKVPDSVQQRGLFFSFMEPTARIFVLYIGRVKL